MIIPIAETKPTPFDLNDFSVTGNDDGKIVLTLHPDDIPSDHRDLTDTIQAAEIMLDRYCQRPTSFTGMDLKTSGEIEMRFAVAGSAEDWKYYVG